MIPDSGPKLVLGTQYSAGVFNGLMVLGQDAEGFAEMLKLAYSIRIRTLDTAPIYARTFAEKGIGEHGWGGEIWTKIGVDVESALPKVDYELSSMRRSLEGSLRRMRRQTIEVAFIHNPCRSVVQELPFSAIHDELTRGPLRCVELGISISGADVLHQLVQHPVKSVSTVMVEIPARREDWATIKALKDFYRVAIRGVLGQGRQIKSKHDAPRAIITERIAEIAEALRPDYIVIGPRTIEQLRDYRLPGNPSG